MSNALAVFLNLMDDRKIPSSLAVCLYTPVLDQKGAQGWHLNQSCIVPIFLSPIFVFPAFFVNVDEHLCTASFYHKVLNFKKTGQMSLVASIFLHNLNSMCNSLSSVCQNLCLRWTNKWGRFIVSHLPGASSRLCWYAVMHYGACVCCSPGIGWALRAPVFLPLY